MNNVIRYITSLPPSKLDLVAYASLENKANSSKTSLSQVTASKQLPLNSSTVDQNFKKQYAHRLQSAFIANDGIPARETMSALREAIADSAATRWAHMLDVAFSTRYLLTYCCPLPCGFSLKTAMPRGGYHAKEHDHAETLTLATEQPIAIGQEEQREEIVVAAPESEININPEKREQQRIEELSIEESGEKKLQPQELSQQQREEIRKDFLQRAADGQLTKEEQELMAALEQHNLSHANFSLLPQNPNLLQQKAICHILPETSNEAE